MINKGMAVAGVVAVLTMQAFAVGAPLGHPDFVPTPERPMGWRGNNQGHYQGEGFPTAWSNGHNIAWNTEMPGWGLSQPIAVGDVVVTTVEPDLVVGVDAKTGKILWQRELNPFVFSGMIEDEQHARKALCILRQCDFLTLKPDTRGNVWTAEKHQSYYVPMRWAQRRAKLINEATKVFPEFGLKPIDPAEVDRQIQGGVDMGDVKIINAAIRAVDAESQKIYNEIGKRGRFFTLNPWPQYIGPTMPTPVTDGKRIFVSMGQGQVACLDAAGNILWKTFMPRQANTIVGHEGIVPSSILVDGKLLVHLKNDLEALDATTGKSLWRVQIGDPSKVWKWCSTGAILDLNGTLVYVSGKSPIFRLSDGHRMCDGFTDTAGRSIYPIGSEQGGSSVLTDGKDTVFILVGGNTGVQTYAVRLHLDAPDRVRGEVLWGSEKARAMNASPLLFDGHIYQNNLVRSLAQQGNVVKELNFKNSGDAGATSMSAAGGFAFASGWKKGKISEAVKGYDLHTYLISMRGDQSVVLPVSVISGLPWPRIPWMDEYREAFGQKVGDTFAEGFGGNVGIYWAPEGARIVPAYPNIAAPVIVGNRIYYHTCGSLICIASLDNK